MGARSDWTCASGKGRRTDKRGMAGYQTGSPAFAARRAAENSPSLNYIRTFDGQRLPSADWHIVRSIVMERDRYACPYCGSDKQLEADHILPLSRGSSNDFVNLATACRSCNLSKGSKAVENWSGPERESS